MELGTLQESLENMTKEERAKLESTLAKKINAIIKDRGLETLSKQVMDDINKMINKYGLEITFQIVFSEKQFD